MFRGLGVWEFRVKDLRISNFGFGGLVFRDPCSVAKYGSPSN